jgi:glucose-1-phosphate thymidylyltransferase
VERDRQDEYVGTLVNAYLAAGGVAHAVRAGRTYVDVGTLHGYREAMNALAKDESIRAFQTDAAVPPAKDLESTTRRTP